jgi:hypothetical protein
LPHEPPLAQTPPPKTSTPPKVPHPRWSQAQEQILIDSPRPSASLKTLLFNNYTDEVQHMYVDAAAKGREYFF